MADADYGEGTVAVVAVVAVLGNNFFVLSISRLSYAQIEKEMCCASHEKPRNLNLF